MWKWRSLRSLLVIGLLAAGIQVAVPALSTPAFAATCTGTGCDNVDPHTAGCVGANPANMYDPAIDWWVSSQPMSDGGRVWLAHSRICDTVWAVHAYGSTRATITVRGWSDYAGGYLINFDSIGNTVDGGWTNMLYYPAYWVDACISTTSQTKCTTPRL